MALRFSDFDAEAFLRDYWQKQPLLLRSPWVNWSNPLEPDELAGLACEPHVESRLISQRETDYDLEHGPLSSDRFGAVGEMPWTLLVQAVDHHVPAVAALIEPFRFIPNWRVDDVMVSYASDGGGVGAHFDQYDVFLIQGMGRRRWQLGGWCDDDTELLAHDDLRLLANFEPQEEWVLEPGDILYVPPRIAHRGVAVGHDCMTYSVGFRAPSRDELIVGWSEALSEELSEADRYSDAGLSMQENPGEITAVALSQLHSMITERLSDKRSFAQWFGQYATSPKNSDIDWRPEATIELDEVVQILESDQILLRNPASRFAFIEQNDRSVLLLVDGECTECTREAAAFARALCAAPRVPICSRPSASRPIVQIVHGLLNRGCIAFETGSED